LTDAYTDEKATNVCGNELLTFDLTAKSLDRRLNRGVRLACGVVYTGRKPVTGLRPQE